MNYDVTVSVLKEPNRTLIML